jgi:hypothetical protein
MPRPTTARAERRGTQDRQEGSRARTSTNTLSFTERTTQWYESARCTVGFIGSISGEVRLNSTLDNLRKLLDAGPRTDLAGLRRMATERRKQLDPEKVDRHFEAGGQGPEAAYYACVLTQLYTAVTKLRQVRAKYQPTGIIIPNRISALGFPKGPSPQETRQAVVAWGRHHMGTWSRGNSARTALHSAMAAYVQDTAELNREPQNLRTAQEPRPSVRLISTHRPDSAEIARRLEVAERTQACVIYSRGEVPSWLRNYSPLEDVQFIRNMTASEQAAFANLIPIQALTAFMAASTDAALQEREHAEVRKHTNIGSTPPWRATGRHTETTNLTARTPTTDQGYPARSQTSPVTASSLPRVSNETETPIQHRRESLAGRTTNTNYFAPLGANEDEDDDENGETSQNGDPNDEADQYGAGEEIARLYLQQPGANATVRTRQPTFPPAPELRPPSSDADTSDVKAFDSVSWEELITPANLATIREVPSELQGDLLDAMRDVLQHLNDALEGPEVELERWYKFWMLFPLLFLRTPPRGGRRGQGLIASRLDAHKHRNYDLLLSWYFSDREIADRALRNNPPATRERTLKKVLAHTSAGRYSKAMRLISSHGLGDSTCNDIREQMRKKFPDRKGDVGPLSDYIGNGTPAVTKVTSAQIVKAIRNLAPGSAPGPDGFHVEYLKMALKVQNLEIGQKVTEQMARLATTFGAGLLPVHFYYLESGAWLVPAIKAKITSATVKVPCRPICIGNVRVRVVTSTIVTENADNLAKVYEPQQLGFTKNGCELVPLIVQLHLETRTDHAAIKLDSENHFNEAKRRAALEFCASRPAELGPITPVIHALHEYGSPLHYHDGTRADDMVEGGQQGSVLAAHLAALALQPVLQTADNKLKENGGCVLAIADDVYMLAHPDDIVAVFPEYKANLKEMGGSINEAKNAALLGATCKLPDDFPVGRGAIYDGPGGTTGNHVGYGIVCVGIPIGEPAFVRRFLELKQEEAFEKIDRTVELLAPAHSHTALQLTRACLNPMMDFLSRGLDATANTLPFFLSFDEKILDTLAILMGHGKRWPTDGTDHLERDAWRLAAERIRTPQRHGGLGIPAAVSKCPVGKAAAVIDCMRLGLKGVHAKSPDEGNRAPTRVPLFPSCILEGMSRVTRGSLYGMRPLLRLRTSIGEAFERNWATCQQLADEGTQDDPTRVETLLNWPAESAGNSADGKPLMRVQNEITRKIAKVAATNLDLQIRNLPSSNPVQLAWVHADRNSTVFANVIPTELYKLTNQQLHSAASVCLGLPNPVCIPHIGTSLVRRATEDEEDDGDEADRPQQGDTVDPFGFRASTCVQRGGSWKERHDQFAACIVQMMQFVSMKARTEPRNVVNQHVPARLLRDLPREDRAQWHRKIQGAIPDVAYTDPGHGREMIAELKCINMGPGRYDSREATSLRAAVNKREQQLYQEYLAKLRKKDRDLLHTPDGEVGPLERGFTSAVSREDFQGWVLGFYNEQSDGLAKLPVMLADAQIARWQSRYGRDPTDQQRSWLVNKIRTDIAMMGTKLNAQVIIKNLQNMHAKSLPPTGARARLELEYQDWARLQGRGPHTSGPKDRLVGWRMW